MNLLAANVNWRICRAPAMSAVSQRRLQGTGSWEAVTEEDGRTDNPPGGDLVADLAKQRRGTQMAVATGENCWYKAAMREFGRSANCQANPDCVRQLSPFVQEGFTLIELLIVLALLIVLTTTMWSFGSPNNQRRQMKACQGNLQKIHLALQIYSTDFGGKYPLAAGARTSEEVLDALVPRYTADTGIFICPGGRDGSLPAGESFRKRRISYAYYMGEQPADPAGLLMSDRQVDTGPKAAGQAAFSETGKPPGNNHHKYGGNFLYCDGHVESSPARVPFSLVITQGVVLLNPKP